MNAKLLFIATVALAVASSFAQATDNTTPLTRAEAKADVQRALADGTLPVSDHAGDDHAVHAHAAVPAANRATVSLPQRLRAALGPDAS